MSKAARPVLLIGGIPGGSPEEILRHIGPALGDVAIGLPDGEPGVRRFWVLATAYRVFRPHPDIEIVRKPQGVPGMPEYVPQGYHDFYIFTLKKGVDSVRFDTLHYPEDAISSYRVFCKLRDEGVIPKGVRFQQSLPFPEDAVRLFTNTPRDMKALVEAYVDAMKRDVRKMCDAIPHDDFIIQWDINWETIAIDHGDYLKDQPPMAFKPEGEPFERYLRYIRELSPIVPEKVTLGIHFCYGDLHHRHFLDPSDLGPCVRMANAAAREAGRRIDFFHMPVPRHRKDDAFFAPLEDLDIGDAALYIGLVHYTDGLEGTRERIGVCKRHYDGPLGVATECGLGRRPKDQDLDVLLRLHREAAAAI